MPSCKKDKTSKGTAGTEIADVRTEGNVKTIALDFTPGSQTVTAITLKNVSDGSTGTVHVKLATDNAAVTAEKLKPLPANSYTPPALEYDVPANGTVTVPLVINRSNLTVDTTFGIGFTIAEVNAGTIAADAKKIVVKITLRNRWDGRYKVTGSMTDATQPTYAHVEHEMYLITTSPTQVKMIPKELGIEGTLITIGGSKSYYSNFGPVFNFDPATNKISSVINHYGQPASNGRSAETDPSGTNTWNPANKNIVLKYWMNEPAIITPHRSSYNNTYTYLGER